MPARSATARWRKFCAEAQPVLDMSAGALGEARYISDPRRLGACTALRVRAPSPRSWRTSQLWRTCCAVFGRTQLLSFAPPLVSALEEQCAAGGVVGVLGRASAFVCVLVVELGEKHGRPPGGVEGGPTLPSAVTLYRCVVCCCGAVQVLRVKFRQPVANATCSAARR